MIARIDTPELRRLLSDALISQREVWTAIEEITLLTAVDFTDVEEWVSEAARCNSGATEADTQLVAERFVAEFDCDTQCDGEV